MAASMMIWGTEVTPLQFFGYGIALCGLVYYKLGAEQLKEHFGQCSRAWADFGSRRPALRKIIVFGVALLVLFILLGGLAPKYAPEYDPKAAIGNSKIVNSFLGDKAT